MMHLCPRREICLPKALDKASAWCRERGLRLTPMRRQVLEAILLSPRGLQVKGIVKAMGEAGKPVKPMSAYRAVDFLHHNGLIHKLESLNAYWGCSRPGIGGRCCFLICQSCGAVEECINDSIDRAIGDTTEVVSFHPSRTNLEIHGRCRGCSEILANFRAHTR